MEKRSVFISYAPKDHTIAVWLSAILEQNGISSYLPTDEERKSPVALEMIDASSSFLLIYSSDSKTNALCSAETDHAFVNKKAMLSILNQTKDVEEEYGYYLSTDERVKLFKKKSRALRIIVSRIKALDGSLDTEYTESRLATLDPALLTDEDVLHICSGKSKRYPFSMTIITVRSGKRIKSVSAFCRAWG